MSSYNSHLLASAHRAGFPISMMNGDDITFTDAKPSASALADIKREARRAFAEQTILQQIEAMGRSLVRGYPQTEQDGWPVKLTEAKAVIDGSLKAEEAFQLGIEASLTGEDVADLANATIAAAELTGMIPAITAGLRRRLQVAIAAADSEEAIAAIQANVETMRSAIMAAFATGDPAQVKAALGAV